MMGRRLPNISAAALAGPALAALLLLQSCSKADREEERHPVGVCAEMVATKAMQETTLATLRENGFGLAILDGFGDSYYNGGVTFGDGAFSLCTPCWWPLTGTLDFHAVYPPYTLTAGSSEVSFDFTADGASDVVVASVNGATWAGGDVSLPFTHSLAAIRVWCRAGRSTQDVRVTLISVMMPGQGTYTFSDGAWSTSGTKTSVMFHSEGEAVATDSFRVMGDTVTSFPAAGQLTVSWNLYAGGSYVDSSTCTVDITPVAGKVNNYKCILTSMREEMAFSSSVTDWDAPAETDVALD